MDDPLAEFDDADDVMLEPSSFDKTRSVILHRHWRIFIGLLIFMVIALGFTIVIAVHMARPIEANFTQELPIDHGEYRHAAVVTDTIACSKVGRDILQQNGSAVDAAIATMFCVGVVNAQSCGIGGGHFMTIYDRPRGSSQRVMKTINAREMAAGAAFKDMYKNNTNASDFGSLSIAVPGEVMGYYEAWRMFGRLPWAELLQPVIDMCMGGFEVEWALALAIRKSEHFIRQNEEFRKLYVKEDGSLVQLGDRIYMHTLGATFGRIAEDPMSFYHGSLANDIVEDLQNYSSIITNDDLANYTAQVSDPVVSHLANAHFTLYAPPAPSGGVISQFILNVLDGYNFNADSIASTDKKILTYHRIVEAFKFGFAKRSYLGDRDFEDVEEITANLTSSEYAASIRAQINDMLTQNVSYYEPNFTLLSQSNRHGTAHASIYASDGGVVSITSTVDEYFGSQLVGIRTGIIFNGEMDDFSIPGKPNEFHIPPSPSNYIAARKRPMSSMSPLIVTDNAGDVVLVTGASGGSHIISSVAYTAVHNLWLGKDIRDAVEFPRLHHQLVPDCIEPENSFDEDVRDGLKQKGHVFCDGWEAVVGSVRNVCSAQEWVTADNSTKCLHAISDPRKEGRPSGY